MNSKFVITPTREAIAQALDAWQWLPIGTRQPILVAAFGDIFFEGQDGVWFLDTLEGNLNRVCTTRLELEKLLSTNEGENQYFLAGFVERAHREGMILTEGECYNFKLHPAVGGKLEYDNLEPRDFVVSVHIAGQIHDQNRRFPSGTKITRFVFHK